MTCTPLCRDLALTCGNSSSVHRLLGGFADANSCFVPTLHELVFKFAYEDAELVKVRV
jgi:hypothetical protein